MTGKIKNLVANRGFGFIRATDGMEYFFHRDEYEGDWGHLESQIVLGNTDVTFDVAQSNKGPRACNMRLTTL